MKIYIETLGCPKNENDSQMAAAYLEEAGHQVINAPKDADFIMVNTCGFINDAKKESIDKIFEMADMKKREGKLIVSGCLSQRYGDELYKEMPEVACFIGVDQYEKLPEIIDELSHNQERILKNGRTQLEYLEKTVRKLDENPYTATLKIAEGCDNFCTYCIIPKIRGPYRSKKMEDIIEEAEELAKAGCKELILIAQDLTYYGKDIYGEYKLAELLSKLCLVEGIQWIRLMYCYEDKITDQLIEVMAKEEKICKYIDIPLQHASDKVLKRMNRKSTKASIKEVISKLKTAMPDIHIRTTMIVGFPQEDEADFLQLLDFVEEEKFARLGVFPYSQEEDTPAAIMDGQIDEEIKEHRVDAIMRRQMDISRELNENKIGNIYEVIIDRQEEEGVYVGRTRYDAPEIDNEVVFKTKGNHEPGEIVYVKITDGFDYDLIGEEV